MNRAWPISLPSLAICLAAGQAAANGIAINEQNASSLGTAFAGRASAALDASTLYGNPAGMSRLQRREVSGGLAYLTVNSAIDGARSDIPGVTGTAEGDMVPDSLVPFGYVVTPLDERWHVGLGLYAPFALLDDYEDGFIGRYKAQRSAVKVITLQPTLSYRVNERVAIGFGPTLNRIEGELTNALNLVTRDAELKIEGDDIGYGFNLGVLVDLTPALAWGLTYHSRVDYHLEGHTRVSGVPALLPGLDSLNGRYDAALDFTTPESLDTSVSWRFSPRWTLHAGATWTRWSRLDRILVENQGVPLPDFSDIEERLDWEDTWAFAVGATYQLDRAWVLRAGLALDPSPTRDADRTARIPVGDRRALALGAGWSPTPDIRVDVAYAYLREDDAGVNQPAAILQTGAGPVPIQPGYYAEYDNRIQVFATQLTYRF